MRIARRRFLGALGWVVVWTGVARRSAGSSDCSTSADVQGPFLRPNAPFRTRLDDGYRGPGDPLAVVGRVLSPDCETPVVDAMIDIWHAGPDGEYDQTSDDFLFRGRLKTDAEGGYGFSTRLPAPYRDAGLDRPRHIHYRITAPGHEPLVTQLYFEGDPRLAGDVFVQRNDGLSRVRPYSEDDNGVHRMAFDLVLARS